MQGSNYWFRAYPEDAQKQVKQMKMDNAEKMKNHFHRGIGNNGSRATQCLSATDSLTVPGQGRGAPLNMRPASTGGENAKRRKPTWTGSQSSSTEDIS